MMNLKPLKQAYWSLLQPWNRLFRPTNRVITPHSWMEAIESLVPRDQDRVVYVDGGAHDGKVARTFIRRYPNLEVHAFEPNADLLEALAANTAGVPGAIHQSAIGSGCGHASIHINESAMTSSLLPRAEYGKRYFESATRTREMRRVPMTSLDTWARQQGIDRVDILKLDLQGYELEALRGASKLLDRGVACVFTEINFVPLYDGCALFSDVDQLLRQNGYRLLNLYNLSTKTRDRQLCGGDALYVPDRQASAAAMRRAA